MVLKWGQTYRCNNYCKLQKIFSVWIICYKLISQRDSAAVHCPRLHRFTPGKIQLTVFLSCWWLFCADGLLALMGYSAILHALHSYPEVLLSV